MRSEAIEPAEIEPAEIEPLEIEPVAIEPVAIEIGMPLGGTPPVSEA